VRQRLVHDVVFGLKKDSHAAHAIMEFLNSSQFPQYPFDIRLALAAHHSGLMVHDVLYSLEDRPSFFHVNPRVVTQRHTMVVRDSHDVLPFALDQQFSKASCLSPADAGKISGKSEW
jgi:hypothetical protein